jgi:hypothetical protein
MQTKAVFTTLLAVAVLVAPAAVPASQPDNVRLDAMAAPVTVAPAEFAALLADPQDGTDFAIMLPTGYTTLEWINQDPFAL